MHLVDITTMLYNNVTPVQTKLIETPRGIDIVGVVQFPRAFVVLALTIL